MYMKLSIRELRQVVAECIAGSQPEEMYENEIVDDPALAKTSLLVNDETKKKMRKYFKDMGLATH